MQGVSPCPRCACELPEQAEQEGCNDSTTIPDFYFRKLPDFVPPPRGQPYPRPTTPGSCHPFTQRKIFSRQRTHRSGHARLDNGRPFVNTGYKEGGQVSKRVDNKTNCTLPPPPLSHFLSLLAALGAPTCSDGVCARAYRDGLCPCWTEFTARHPPAPSVLSLHPPHRWVPCGGMLTGSSGEGPGGSTIPGIAHDYSTCWTLREAREGMGEADSVTEHCLSEHECKGSAAGISTHLPRWLNYLVHSSVCCCSLSFMIVVFSGRCTYKIKNRTCITSQFLGMFMHVLQAVSQGDAHAACITSQFWGMFGMYYKLGRCSCEPVWPGGKALGW